MRVLVFKNPTYASNPGAEKPDKLVLGPYLYTTNQNENLLSNLCQHLRDKNELKRIIYDDVVVL